MTDVPTRLGRNITTGLTHRLRASGPHDFAAAHTPAPVSDGWRALATGTERGHCQRRVVPRVPLLTGIPRPAVCQRADAVAATASRPASRDDRETPLLGGRDGQDIRYIRILV